MRRAVGCGIDLGTSNSSVSVAYEDGSVDVVSVGPNHGSTTLPSYALLHRNGDRQAGANAIRQYLLTGANRTQCYGCDRRFGRASEGRTPCREQQPGGACNDARFIYGLKLDLTNEWLNTTHSWGFDFSIAEILAILLRTLKLAAERHAGTETANVVLGIPFGFVGAEEGEFEYQQRLAISRLVDGCELAGFVEVETLYEPEAAGQLAEPPPGLTAVVDFGGGTFDVAVLEKSIGGSLVTAKALQGAAVGGTDFDGLLFDHYVWHQLGPEKRHLGEYWRHLRTLHGVRFLLADVRFGHLLARLRRQGVDTGSIEEIVYGGRAYDFYRTIESAKHALSFDDRATIAFHRPGISVEATIFRTDFEQLIEPCLHRVESAIDAALDEARVSGYDIDGVMVTGGTSYIPAFRDLIREKFPRAAELPLPPFTAVAEGLGRRAAALWA